MKKRTLINYYAQQARLLLLLTLYTPNLFCTNISPDIEPGKTSSWSTVQHIEDIPPTTTSLIKQQNQTKEQESLKNIKNIVSNALSKKQKNNNNNKTKKTAKNKNSRTDKIGIDITRELTQLLQEQYQDKELTKPKLSLELKKVDIKKAINLISKITGVNFIIDTQVSGSIDTIKFDNITLAQALSILCNNNKPRLALIKETDLWRIVTKATALKLLESQALDLREKNFTLDVATIFHAKWDQEFKKRIEKLWKDILGDQAEKNGNYLTFDDQNKKVFFKGDKDLIKDFKKILSEIDIKVPQVRIDARVVIAQKDFEETIGIQWSGIYDRSSTMGKSWNIAGAGIGEKTAGDGFKDLMNWSLNLLPSAASSALPIKVPFIFGRKDITTHRLNLMLNAAENRNEIKTMLKPSLLVKSDETAQIMVGENMPQDIRLQETVEGQPTNITSISYKDIGMQIKVKPTVSPDQERVFLDIFVENSIIKQPSFNRTRTSATAQSSFNWTIETSRSQNRVILESGQTTLISGLMINTSEINKTGVPLLQEIPVIGLLFQGKRKMMIDKQILIFITPTLI